MSVFLDMSKAFDCVDHNILLQKMLVYGIKGSAFSWFESYLSYRRQRVIFNGTLSENTYDVKCGVPQGSISGPLLYLIYINDINQCLKHCNVTLYADLYEISNLNTVEIDNLLFPVTLDFNLKNVYFTDYANPQNLKIAI